MSDQPNRLAAEGDHRFKGSEIDRQRPLRFRLDGHAIHGYAGDTVLSAALASGLIGAGFHAGESLALDERFALAVRLAGQRRDAVAAALPMARTPAIDGLELVTIGTGAPGLLHRVWNRLIDGLGRKASGLGLSYGGENGTPPWIDIATSERRVADLVVIGGGIAGMSAALEAAKHSQRITLIERRSTLEGNAGFFGATGDEEAPEATIERLRREIADTPAISVFLRAEVFSLGYELVQLHQVTVENGLPVGKILVIETPRVVIATGVLERLPIFPGNRQPGVVGSLEAHDRAARFGVWIGRRTLFATTTSIAYRLAAQIKGSEIVVDRVVDTRINPQSRFVEIGKAYGIPQSPGSRPIAVRRAGGGLRVVVGASLDGGTAQARRHYFVDQFTISGGWQPELALWHMAGGASRWEASRHALTAYGTLSGIVLAGSAAGFETTEACRESGEVAAAQVFGHTAPEVEEQRIATIHESADDPTPIAPADPPGPSTSYLDGGLSLVTRPAVGRRHDPASRRDRGRMLGVADVAAAVQLGIVPPEDAGAIARERCVAPNDIAGVDGCAIAVGPVAAGDVVPDYLAGRFGATQTILHIEAADGRRLDIGCLINAAPEDTDPLTAVGVVIGSADSSKGGGRVLLGSASSNLLTLWVRDISGTVAVHLVDNEKHPVALTESATPDSERSE